MIIPILVVGLFVGLSAINAPEIKSVDDLVWYSRCDPHRIVHGAEQSIKYVRTSGWQSGDDCIRQGYGDCKCQATITAAALTKCGYRARLSTFSRIGAGHALSLYEKPDGTRGYLNGIAKEFDKGTDWDFIYSTIPPYDWKKEKDILLVEPRATGEDRGTTSRP